MVRKDVLLFVTYGWVKNLIDDRNAEDLDKANHKSYRAGEWQMVPSVCDPSCCLEATYADIRLRNEGFDL